MWLKLVTGIRVMLLLLRVLLGEKKKERMIGWSIICISSPTHHLQKQPVKILGKQQDTVPDSCDNLWHAMKDSAQGKQPTAASGWLEITVSHVWVTRGTENEFLSPTGTDPDLSAQLPLCLKTWCSLSGGTSDWAQRLKAVWRILKYCDQKRAVGSPRLVSTACWHGQTAPIAPQKQRMDGLPLLPFLRGKYMGSGAACNKACPEPGMEGLLLLCQGRAYRENLGCWRDPLRASQEEWAEIAISCVCCSHLCSS